METIINFGVASDAITAIIQTDGKASLVSVNNPEIEFNLLNVRATNESAFYTFGSDLGCYQLRIIYNKEVKLIKYRTVEDEVPLIDSMVKNSAPTIVPYEGQM
jgi:hypothetical protein